MIYCSYFLFFQDLILKPYQKLFYGVRGLEICWYIIVFEHSSELFRHSTDIGHDYREFPIRGIQLFLGVQMRIVLSYLQIDAMLKWLHVNREMSVVVCCYVTTKSSILSHPLLGDPSEIISRGGTQILLFFGGDPDFANLLRKGSQILTILTRTSLANDNLKVYTPPSDDFWMVPYHLYLFLAKLPAWFTWTKPVMLIHFGMCSLD